MIVKQQRASRNQRKNITTALNVANRMRAPRSHRVALVAAIIVENSGWNKPWGHGTSVGILQLIDVHGTLAWRMKIKNSAGWFLRGARKLDPRGTARLATNKYSWGLVQRVQRSGVPFAYNERLPEARRIVANWYKTCPS